MDQKESSVRVAARHTPPNYVPSPDMPVCVAQSQEQEMIDAFKNTNDLLKSEIDVLKREIGRLTNDLSKTDAFVREKNDVIVKQQREICSITVDKHNAQEECRRLLREKKRLNSFIQQYLQKLSNCSSTINSLQGEIQGYKAKIKKLDKEKKKLEAENGDLKEEILNLQNSSDDDSEDGSDDDEDMGNASNEDGTDKDDADSERKSGLLWLKYVEAGCAPEWKE